MNTLALVVGVGACTSVGWTARHTAFLLRAGVEPVLFSSEPVRVRSTFARL